MHITAIIAEYNPFHAGHAYQIRCARELGADYVLVIMSPDFVQRGEPALVDKYTRTRMALQGGADAVLEMPLRYATGSAEYFARGAVSSLDSLGCIDTLCFGCEAPDMETFSSLSAFLLEEPADYRHTLRSLLKSGLTYPAARQQALTLMQEKGLLTLLGGADVSILSSPNNILALEYMKAIQNCRSAILPLPILREGAGYHSQDLTGRYPSASGLRRSLLSGKDSSLPDLTQPWSAPLLDALRRRMEISAVYDRYSQFLAYALLEKADHLEDYLDVTPDLANRIRQVGCGRLLPYSELAEQIKTRQLTQSRVRRALLHIFLGIKKEEAIASPSYIRLLGFRRQSSALLHVLKECSALPLITKNAAALRILDAQAAKHFQADLHASELYGMLEGQDQCYGSELRHSPISF